MMILEKLRGLKALVRKATPLPWFRSEPFVAALDPPRKKNRRVFMDPLKGKDGQRIYAIADFYGFKRNKLKNVDANTEMAMVAINAFPELLEVAFAAEDLWIKSKAIGRYLAVNPTGSKGQRRIINLVTALQRLNAQLEGESCRKDMTWTKKRRRA